MRACPNCGQEGPEGARFCPACGMALAAERHRPHEVRKVVTIVFCDLSGSTSLGERLDPESVRQMVGRYFKAMSDALERHGGTVEKFIGDAVVAVFGIPSVREDDAFRAVRAAVEMRAALEKLNQELERRFGVRLRARIGVNTGEVIAGDASRGDAFATGDAMNVAARFEQAAGPGEILIGEQTYELVRDAAQVEPVPPLDLKGKSEPVPAFRLIDVVARAARPPARPTVPLVGRERERALLREAFERTLSDRTCELVTVLGPAGIGKSRLTREFADGVEGAAKVAVGRCLSYGEGLTFWPLRGVVEGLAGTDDGDSPEEAQAKIARLLSEDDERATIVERLAGALALSDAVADPTETAWAVRRLLEAVAAEQPLVVIFEDAHWAEANLLELVKYLAATIQRAPVLIVVTARTGLLDVAPDFAGGLANATRMELRPLSGAETSALVEHLTGDAAAASDLSERMFTAGGGNPLFVEELVRLLDDQRRPATDEPRSSWARELSALSVPPTIHALLAARLDRLDPAERAVVDAAAVIGRSFAGAAVVELGRGDDRSELDRHLQALVRKDLIEPTGGRFAGEEAFAFKHVLLRDVAYGGILKEVRADFHERFADWLERAVEERVGEYEEILAYHLDRAYSYLTELGPTDERGRDLAARASARLGASGRRALARGDISPAVNLLERAVSLLAEDDPARRELTLKLGIALAETGQLTRADGLLHDRIEAERRGRTFVVFHDAATGKQQLVDVSDHGSTLTIGRRADNDVALYWDKDVSRRHAELRRTPESWTLVDADSRNGSYVNGQRLSGPHPLRDGDVLRFGDTVVLFRMPAVGKAPESAQPGQVTSLGQRSTHWAARPGADVE